MGAAGVLMCGAPMESAPIVARAHVLLPPRATRTRYDPWHARQARVNSRERRPEGTRASFALGRESGERQ